MASLSSPVVTTRFVPNPATKPLFPFSQNNSQVSLLTKPKRSFARKVSCKATNNDQNDQAQSKLDRRNVLLGLGGLYGVAGMGTDPFAFAKPIAPPDVSKCGSADLPPGAEATNCCPPPATKIIDFKLPAPAKLRIRPPAHAVDQAYRDKFYKAMELMKALPDDDPRSFKQQAAVHCAYCDGAYDQAGFPELELQVHNSWLFFLCISIFACDFSQMSAASSLTLFLHRPPPPPPLLPRRHHYYSLSPLSLSFKSFKPPNTMCFSSNASHDETEESRWLREEQRWLREEQRWLREEQRWARDRDALLREIAELKLKIQALERQGGLGGGASVVSESDTIASVAGLLQMLKEKNLIAETGSSSKALELNHQEIQGIQEKEVIAVSEVKQEEKKMRRRSRSALRKGLEGEEVRAMQEALLKLGFYSGEEDMEFSSFSTGTERAVKTWQASLDIPQDGIVAAELLQLLFADPKIEGADDERASTPKEDANGAAVTSATEITEVQQTVVKEEDGTEVEVSHHRVFLLGENRWEDSSRLITNKKKGGDGKTGGASSRCLTCRGEGRLLCTECDGTGEPNIEEQFLDWVEEGAKCPYCEGLGYTICDVCDGTPVA